MNKQRLRMSWIGMALICLLAGSAAGQYRDLSLDQYVGKYPDKQFLALAAVHDPLTRLLGRRLKPFLARFQVLTPIDKVSDDVVAQGCVRHNCTNEQAAFAINLNTGAATAASLTEGRYMDIYSASTAKYDDLPPGLRRWIRSRTSQSTSFKKMRFRFVK
jgi:hypothetical protein